MNLMCYCISCTSLTISYILYVISWSYVRLVHHYLTICASCMSSLDHIVHLVRHHLTMLCILYVIECTMHIHVYLYILLINSLCPPTDMNFVWLGFKLSLKSPKLYIHWWNTLEEQKSTRRKFKSQINTQEQVKNWTLTLVNWAE